MSLLDQVKDVAARQVGKVLANETTMKVLSSPQVKNAFVTAINLRAEARDVMEMGVKQVAKQLDLVTREDVAKLKRSMRDLQHEVEDLREQLATQAEAPAVEAAPAAKPAARKRK